MMHPSRRRRVERVQVDMLELRDVPSSFLFEAASAGQGQHRNQVAEVRVETQRRRRETTQTEVRREHQGVSTTRVQKAKETELRRGRGHDQSLGVARTASTGKLTLKLNGLAQAKSDSQSGKRTETHQEHLNPDGTSTEHGNETHQEHLNPDGTSTEHGNEN